MQFTSLTKLLKHSPSELFTVSSAQNKILKEIYKLNRFT